MFEHLNVGDDVFVISNNHWNQFIAGKHAKVIRLSINKDNIDLKCDSFIFVNITSAKIRLLTPLERAMK